MYYKCINYCIYCLYYQYCFFFVVSFSHFHLITAIICIAGYPGLPYIGFPTGFWHSAHANSCRWIVNLSKIGQKDPVLYSTEYFNENDKERILHFNNFSDTLY